MTAKTNPDPTPNASVPKFVDIGALDTIAASDAGAEIELLHPITKAPLGVFIGVLGKHSTVFRELVNERTNQRLRDEAQRTKRGKDQETITAEKVTERAIELLVACSTHWRSETRDDKGVVTANEPHMIFKGEPLPFTVANARRVYEGMIWVREQVDAGIGDLENFIKD